MYELPKKVEDWTQNDCNVLLSQLKAFYRKYNINKFYVIGSRCNGINDPQDIDISLEVSNDIVAWRNLSIDSNYAELLKRSISEKRMAESFGEKFNIIIENQCSQKLYNTIEKFNMPYFDLETCTLYNKTINDRFPYKVITYDYDSHIFYMKLRPEGLTQDEIIYYTNKVYENLTPVINSTISIGDSERSFMVSNPYNIISFLINCSFLCNDLDSYSKNWIKNSSQSIKSADYTIMKEYIQKGILSKNSDLFVKLFHDCEIYENLSVF